MQPINPPTYRIPCTGCKDWLAADRPGVQHDGEACVERCAAVFECPREAEQAAVGAGWSLEEQALCPACLARALPIPGGTVEFPLPWSAEDVARWKAAFAKLSEVGD